ncbi:MAG: hypothetical protein WA261_09975, partial [Candidatus Sulfotelmatobacter sp.]
SCAADWVGGGQRDFVFVAEGLRRERCGSLGTVLAFCVSGVDVYFPAGVFDVDEGVGFIGLRPRVFKRIGRGRGQGA